IRVKADTKHLPRFEGMRQHEQLGLGVGRSADCRAGQPRVADLAGVGDVATVPKVFWRPRPSLQVPETGRPNDDTVSQPDDRERHRAAGITPGQSGVDVAGGLDLALRDGTPLVEEGVSCRGGYKAVDVAVVKRFETNVSAWQDKTFCSHAPSMQRVARSQQSSLQPHDSSPDATCLTCFRRQRWEKDWSLQA